MKLGYWHLFEYLALIFSLIYFKGLKNFSLQLMVPFLFYICCSESLAAYYEEWGMPTARGFVNVYYVVSAGVFFFLFYTMIRPRTGLKKIYWIIAILSMIFFLYDLFDSNIYNINRYTAFVSFTQHIVLSLILLFKLSFDENSRISIVKEPYFWIAVGVLIFSLITVVTIGLQPYIYRNKILIFGKSAYMTILPLACVLLYSCYCYAFYLTSKTKSIYKSPVTG